MAYKSTFNKSLATSGLVFAEVSSFLTSCGWTEAYYKNVNYNAIATTDIDYATNDTFTVVGHTLANADRVWYSATTTAIGGLSNNAAYYAVNVSGNTFKLSATYNGSAINLTNAGVGVHTIRCQNGAWYSDSEAADRAPEYIVFQTFITALTTVNIFISYSWDSNNKLPIGYYSTASTLTVNETGQYFSAYGNKDIVFIANKITTTYTSIMFGHLKRFTTITTTLSSSATAGSAVTITVGSTTGFVAGKTYQIISKAGGGRDTVTITSITSSTQMVVTTLPRNYASGSIIGIQSSTFFSNSGVAWAGGYVSSSTQEVGLTAVNSYNITATAPLTAISSSTPDVQLGYLLLPVSFQATAPKQLIGYCDTDFLYYYAVGTSQEDTFDVGRLDSGTAEAGGASTLTDNDKSWGTNVFATKYIVILTGTGSGQIRKIASNNGTVITVNTAWAIQPASGSTYAIAGEVYRGFATTSLTGSTACREEI